MPEPTTTNVTPKREGRLWRIGRWLVRVAAALFLVQIVFAVIGPPGWLTDWLTAVESKANETPHTVVVLGGGGIPSGSGLLRTYYAASFGAMLSNVTFIV